MVGRGQGRRRGGIGLRHDLVDVPAQGLQLHPKVAATLMGRCCNRRRHSGWRYGWGAVGRTFQVLAWPGCRLTRGGRQGVGQLLLQGLQLHADLGHVFPSAASSADRAAAATARRGDTRARRGGRGGRGRQCHTLEEGPRGLHDLGRELRQLLANVLDLRRRQRLGGLQRSGAAGDLRSNVCQLSSELLPNRQRLWRGPLRRHRQLLGLLVPRLLHRRVPMLRPLRRQ
mmetsp:Transcript_92494/g.265104  ORF Transcript_92494/g.265104 Transcript_92494/m.265104 type:complete len:228 (-) Transcript_92494:53-736(-)